MKMRRLLLVVCRAIALTAMGLTSLARSGLALAVERAQEVELAAASPGPSAAEAQLLLDARDGRLDHYPLLSAALIAAGIDDAAVARGCEARLRELADEFRASEAAKAPLAERAGAMHQLLHRRVFSGEYDPSANNIDEVFRHGRFNCITASTLLMALASECGVEAAAWEAPAHVLVVIDPQGVAAAVEMTRREWRCETLAVAMRQRAPATPQASPPASSTAEREGGVANGRLIGPTELLATYYHNRGVERLAARDYAAAVKLNETALQLDRDCAAALQNLLAAWNNWALALAATGDYGGALEKIDRGLAIAPNYEPLRENRIYIESRRAGRQRSPRSALLTTPLAPRFH